jgi:hypothetical protein
MQNNLQTVGSAQVSTSVKKYGTGSLSFNGSGDTLNTPTNIPTHALGSGDFTYEGWFYSLDSGSSLRGMFDTRANATSNGGLLVRENSGGFLVDYGTTAIITTTTGRTANTWQHIAVVRNSGTIYLYVNGVSAGSVANTINFTDTYLRISGFVDTQASPYGYYGYMDDIRVTLGYCRYPSGTTFTPPTQALPTY